MSDLTRSGFLYASGMAKKSYRPSPIAWLISVHDGADNANKCKGKRVSFYDATGLVVITSRLGGLFEGRSEATVRRAGGGAKNPASIRNA